MTGRLALRIDLNLHEQPRTSHFGALLPIPDRHAWRTTKKPGLANGPGFAIYDLD